MKLPINKEQHTKIMPQILVITFSLVLAFLLWNFNYVWGVISKLVSLATPFFAGFCIAFLLGPTQRRVEKLFTKYVFRKNPHPQASRLLSSLAALLMLIALIAVFIVIMLPQLISSIETVISLIGNFLRSGSTAAAPEWLNELLVALDFLSVSGDELVVAWDSIVSRLLKNIDFWMTNIVSIGSGVVNFVFDALVALITGFYILMDKDHLAAQIKKIGYAVFRRSSFEEMILWTRKANRIFAGFITGKIIDSAIIGVICYIGMLIFKMELPLLISCVIGVTNIIPFFGPFIGWVPCALILLIINPMSALWFSLFILFLQQLDGNVIGPHILGDYVGVSALSIMIAIVIGGGMFGFTGMLLSVPLYALGYAFIRTLINMKLKKKGLPTDSYDYVQAPECLPPDTPEDDAEEENEAAAE